MTRKIVKRSTFFTSAMKAWSHFFWFLSREHWYFSDCTKKKMRRLFMLEIFQLVYKKFVYAVTYDRVGHFFLCRSKIFAYFLASNQGIHPLLNNEFAGLRLHIFTNRSKIAKTWKETCFFFFFLLQCIWLIKPLHVFWNISRINVNLDNIHTYLIGHIKYVQRYIPYDNKT